MARVRHSTSRASTRDCPGALAELLTRTGEGDRVAFLRLVDVCYPTVQAIVAGPVRTEWGDDAVVDTFVGLWRTAAEFRASGQEAVHWILRVAHAHQPASV